MGPNCIEPIYNINGIALKVVSGVKDLGVIVDSQLKFSSHVAEVASRASRKINFVLRAFDLNDCDLYIKLFNTFVVPGLMYASPIWYPGLKRDINLLNKVISKFRRRVEFRCGLERRSLQIDSFNDMLVKYDQMYFDRLVKNDKTFNKILKINYTNTRSGFVISALAVPHKKVVADRFPWRYCAFRNGN